MLPSALVSDLEVYKSPMASIDEGSTGGTVLLRTRRPLALEQNTVNLALESQYSESSEEWDPRVFRVIFLEKMMTKILVCWSPAIKQDRTVVRRALKFLAGQPTLI